MVNRICDTSEWSSLCAESMDVEALLGAKDAEVSAP